MKLSSGAQQAPGSARGIRCLPDARPELSYMISLPHESKACSLASEGKGKGTEYSVLGVLPQAGTMLMPAQVVLWVCWLLALPDSCRSSVRNLRENFLCSHDWDTQDQELCRQKRHYPSNIPSHLLGSISSRQKRTAGCPAPDGENVFPWEPASCIFLY